MSESEQYGEEFLLGKDMVEMLRFTPLVVFEYDIERDCCFLCGSFAPDSANTPPTWKLNRFLSHWAPHLVHGESLERFQRFFRGETQTEIATAFHTQEHEPFFWIQIFGFTRYSDNGSPSHVQGQMLRLRAVLDQQEQQVELLMELSDSYRAAYLADLTASCFTALRKHPDFPLEATQDKSRQDCVENYCQLCVPPSFRQEFIQFVTEENLRRAWQGKHLFLRFQQQLGDAEPHWVCVHLMKGPNRRDWPLVLVIFEDIHTEFHRERVAALEAQQIQMATAAAYEMLLSANLTQNCYHLLQCNDFFNQLVPPKGCFDDLVTYAASTVPESYRQQFINSFSREKLLAAHKAGITSVYLEHPQVGADNQIHWVSDQVLFVKSPDTNDVLEITMSRNIEMQKLLEKQLLQERETAYNLLPGDVVKCLMDERLTLLEGTEQYKASFDIQEGEDVACADHIVPEDRERVLRLCQEKAALGEPISIEHQRVSQDGKTLWMRTEGKKVGEQGGIPVYLFVLLDITEQKLAQLALEQEQRRYKAVVENTADELFEYDVASDTLYCQFQAGHGEELVIPCYLETLHELDRIHPEDVEPFKRFIQGNLENLECRIRLKPGSDYTWELAQGNAVRKNGVITRIIGTLRNISDLKRHEIDLEQKRAAVNTTLDAVIGQAFDKVLYFNLRKKKLLLQRDSGQYPPIIDQESVDVEHDLIATMHPADQAAFREAFSFDKLMETFRQGQRNVSLEGRRKGRDGMFHWISMLAVALPSPQEDGPLAVFLLSTIDGRKELENQNRLMMASLLSVLGELIILDVESGLYVVYKGDDGTNATITNNVPADFAVYQQKYAKALIHPEDREQFLQVFGLEALRRGITEGKQRFYCELRRLTGDEWRWCEMVGTALYNGAGGHEVLLTFQDVTELRKAQSEIRNANQRFIWAVNAFYDAIYECELPAGTLKVWKSADPSLRPSVFGINLQEHVDNLLHHIVHPDFTELFRETFYPEHIIQSIKSGKTQVGIETLCQCKDGVYRWFSHQGQLVEQDDDKCVIMLYLKNIDDSKREEERRTNTLKEALILAKQANLAKSDFLSRMSHDIRTPLNAITGMTVLAMRDLGHPDLVQGYLQKIQSSSELLLQMISEVLDMSKIESGRLDLVAEAFNLEQSSREMADLLEPQALQKRQHLETDFSNLCHPEVVGDCVRVKQIMQNLLSNALKYTPEGGYIRFTVEELGAEGSVGTFCFTVEDNGVGIAPDMLEKIFDPFVRVEDSRTSKTPGTGLGLAIAQRFARMMDGNIRVSSGLNQGSTFTATVRLALQEKWWAQEEQETGQNRRMEELHLEKKRILLVEDNELNMEIAVALIRPSGVRIEWAENGKEALDKIQSAAAGYYDLVLMDIQMPVMNGYEATEAIRALPREDTKQLPIIAMTANAFAEDERLSLGAGMNEHLAKPIQPDRLADILYHYLG